MAPSSQRPRPGGSARAPSFGAGSLRVIGGSARGRRLRVPPDSVTRPTRDAVRENVFNLLAARCEFVGARVVDLFAGSGAYGIEALSRGAASCVFVDRSPVAAAVIRANLDSLGMADRGRVVTGPIDTGLAVLGGAAAVDVAFADPPYRYEAWEALLSLLGNVVSPGGIVIAESSNVVVVGADWSESASRRYGSTQITMWTRALGGGSE